MKENRYQTDYDGPASFTSNAVPLIFLSLLAIQSFASQPDNGFLYSILFGFLPIIFLVWTIHPQHYSVTDTGITIKRPIGSIRLSFNEITDIRAVEWEQLRPAYRLLASGGLFGYLGLYISPVIGRFFMWCTNRDRLVMITCRNRIILISPADPVVFVRDSLTRSRSRGV